jgi:hypothetical protein
MKNLIFVFVFVSYLLCDGNSVVYANQEEKKVVDSLVLEIFPGTIRTLINGRFEKSKLERKIYFQSYGLLGGSTYDDKSWDPMLPGRGTGPRLTSLNPVKPDGDVSQSEMKELSSGFINIRKSGFNKRENFAWAIAGSPGTYPQWMRIDGEPEKPVKPAYNQLAAKIVSSWFKELKYNNVKLPKWYTVHNEPPADWSIKDIADLHIKVKEEVDKSVPGVKVMGPCWAWTWPGKDFSVWKRLFVDFMEMTGDKIDGYDLHTYSKGYWAYDSINYKGQRNDMSRRQAHPSLYESMYHGNVNVFDFGVLESQLNMISAFQSSRWNNGPKEIIISEFGHQSIEPQFGPWENEFKDYLYMATVIREWMTFMNHPEVRLCIPFICAHSSPGYAPERGQAIYNFKNQPERKEYNRTRFFDFYNFFSDIQGERILSATKSSNKTFTSIQAFRNGKDIYILIHFGKSIGKYTLHIAPVLHYPGNVYAQSVGIKRLVWEGKYPSDHKTKNPEGFLTIDKSYSDLGSVRNIELQGEETVVLKISCNEIIPTENHLTEYTSYARDVIKQMEVNEPFKTTFEIGNPALEKCFLDLALSADMGFRKPPEIFVNNNKIENHADYRHSIGIAGYNGIETVEVPVSFLVKGKNELKIQIEPGTSDRPAFFVSGKIRCIEIK